MQSIFLLFTGEDSGDSSIQSHPALIFKIYMHFMCISTTAYKIAFLSPLPSLESPYYYYFR
jgi:hypothetical protein